MTAAAARAVGEVVRGGVRVWRDGDALRIRAPDRAVADAARARLAVDRDAVLAILPDGVHHVPLSSAQERLWFLDRAAPDAGAYAMPVALRLQGPLDPVRLSAALTALVGRHEVLRTRMASLDGLPVGIVRHGAAAPIVGVACAAEEVDGLIRAALRRPFDLRRDVSFRAAIYTLAADVHVLLIELHHVAADGWTLRLLLDDLARIHAGEAAGEAPGFADWICARRAASPAGQMAALAERGAAWLAGYPTSLPLPRDRAHRAEPSFRGAQLTSRASPAAARMLETSAREEGATPFVVLLALVATWCHRIGGGDRLLLGAAVAGREDAAAADTAGPFASILPLPCDLGGDPSWRETVRRVRDAVRGAMAFEALPFEMLVERLAPATSPGVPPLVQVTVGARLDALPARFDEGVTMTRVELPRQGAKFDLSVEFAAAASGLELDLGYACDLFDATTAARMAEAMVDLLDAVAADPDARLSSLADTPALAWCRLRTSELAGAAALLDWREIRWRGGDPPRSDDEALLASAMAVVTGTRDIGRDDDFYAIGGHSLRAMQLVELLRERHAVHLPLKDVLLGLSVAELATRIAPVA